MCCLSKIRASKIIEKCGKDPELSPQKRNCRGNGHIKLLTWKYILRWIILYIFYMFRMLYNYGILLKVFTDFISLRKRMQRWFVPLLTCSHLLLFLSSPCAVFAMGLFPGLMPCEKLTETSLVTGVCACRSWAGCNTHWGGRRCVPCSHPFTSLMRLLLWHSQLCSQYVRIWN